MANVAGPPPGLGGAPKPPTSCQPPQGSQPPPGASGCKALRRARGAAGRPASPKPAPRPCRARLGIGAAAFRRLLLPKLGASLPVAMPSTRRWIRPPPRPVTRAAYVRPVDPVVEAARRRRELAFHKENIDFMASFEREHNRA
jgi:hypothetical protein